MTHDDLAADLARKLEKAHGPHGSRRLQVIDEAACEMALWKCAPLLLSERAALRAVEDAAREAARRMRNSPYRLGKCSGDLHDALSALDRLREEA